jgi:hypothetical protein
MNQILLSGRQCIFLFESRAIEINNILSDEKVLQNQIRLYISLNFLHFFKKEESSGDLRN